MSFLCLFLSFNKELFQLLNFTFSCTLIAFIKGLFFDRRVKIIVLLLASYKTHGLLLPFLCASQNNRKCNEFSMASCGFTFRTVKLLCLREIWLGFYTTVRGITFLIQWKIIFKSLQGLTGTNRWSDLQQAKRNNRRISTEEEAAPII